MAQHQPGTRHVIQILRVAPLWILLSGCGPSEKEVGLLMLLTMPIAWIASSGMLFIAQKVSYNRFIRSTVVKYMYPVISLILLAISAVMVFRIERFDAPLAGLIGAMVSLGIIVWFIFFWLLILIARRLSNNTDLLDKLPELVVPCLVATYTLFGFLLHLEVYPKNANSVTEVIAIFLIIIPLYAAIPFQVIHLIVLALMFRARRKNAQSQTTMEDNTIVDVFT